jgi:hypothetical protein
MLGQSRADSDWRAPIAWLLRFWEQAEPAPIMGAMPGSLRTPDHEVLRRFLAEIRQGAGLTQRALAERLRVPHSWVATVESGERRVDLVEFC